MQTLARGLAKADLLRPGWSRERAAATLHVLTSVETLLELRRDYGLPLARVEETLRELSRTMIDTAG
jgi:hypothetical protein